MANVALHQWTIPSPRGLWYQAIIRIDHLLFVTAEVDFTTMQTLQQAVGGEPKALVQTLMDHGRFNRPTALKISDVSDLKRDATKGQLIIVTDEKTLSLRVPNRDRLDEVARSAAAILKEARAQSPS